MSDILTTRSLSDATIHRTQSGASGPPTATVLVADAGLKLPSQRVGTLISGIVLEKPSRAHFVIQTDKGSLTIQANIPLQVGSAVVLQLQSVGNQSRVVILSINGQPIGSPDAHSASAPNAGAPPQPFPARPVTTTPGVPSQAAPSIAPSAPASQHAALVREAGQARGTGGLVRTPLVNGLVLPAQVIEATTNPAPGNQTGPFLKTGDTLTVRVLATAGQGADNLRPEVPPQTGPQDWLRGTVANNTSTGVAGGPMSSAIIDKAQTPGLIISTPHGRLSLPSGTPGQVGTGVLLEIIGEAARAGDAMRPTVTEAQQSFYKFAREWSTLKDAAAILAPAGAEAAGLQGVAPLPAPGAALASTMLFFLTALKAGDIRAWLGQAAADQLEGIRDGNLAGRLSDDFQQMGRLSSESQPSGWQVMLLPMARGDIIDQIRMYYRHQHGTDSENGDNAGRFIVEAELKRFGMVQLDGLVKRTQFDLALRSDVQFSTEMKKHIREIFWNALEIGGLVGAVRFETPSNGPLDPFKDDAAAARHGSDVVV